MEMYRDDEYYSQDNRTSINYGVPQYSYNYNYNRKRRRNGPPVIFLIFLSLISAVIGGIITSYIAPKYLYGRYLPNPYTISNGGVQNIEIITKQEDLTVGAAVAKKAMPSVVGITTVTLERNFFFGIRQSEGVGTGVIVDSRGYILTNSHVVNDGNAREVRVLLDSGQTLTAQVLWNDPALDLAVLKVDATNLPVADLGDSDKLMVGEVAIAIGNPLGLSFERTVTAGIISGLNRSIAINEYNSIDGLIQTDASINPGNSGGPLLNAKGEVIGINTAKIQSGEGLGFAIPINIAKPIVDEFIKKGEFTKVYMGIRGVDAANYIRTYNRDIGTEEGVIVYQVTPGSPAEESGLKQGDIIISINDAKISNMRQLQKELYKYRPGDVARLGIVRNREKLSISINFRSEG